MASGPYIVTLDDDPDIHRIIAAATGLPGKAYTSAHQLLKEADRLAPRAAFLDIHLGEELTGLDLVPKLREKWSGCPVLIITSDDREDTVVEALSTGADDCIRKPLQPAEILARFQARLRDVETRAAKQKVEYGDITVHLPHSRVESQRGERSLSPTEMNLLTALIQGAGSVVQRNALKRLCWGRIAVSESALDRKVFEVRKAVKELSETLEVKTIYGKGVALISKSPPQNPVVATSE